METPKATDPGVSASGPAGVIPSDDAALTATSQNSNKIPNKKQPSAAPSPLLDLSYSPSSAVPISSPQTQAVSHIPSHHTSHQPLCADAKKGLQPSPPSNPEPQLVTLKPTFYQPKEFNSFDQPVSPTTNGDFDILSPNTTTTSASSMIFTELYRSRKASLSKTKSNQSSATASNHSSGPDFDPDLLSRDKSKQREAIRRHLEEHVKSDWDFPWTRTDVPALPVVVRETVVDGVVTEVRYHDPAVEATTTTTPLSDVLKNQQLHESEPVEACDTGAEPDSASEDEAADDDDNESVYSVVTEDEARYKPRLEWDSEFMAMDLSRAGNKKSIESASASRDSVLMNKELRRKAVKDEMKWNQGLACFEARRNKWTCAKVARLRPKALPAPVQPPPLSPLSPRRLFFRNSTHASSPPASTLSSNATGSDSDATHPASKTSTHTGASLAASTTSATTGGTSLSSRSCRTADSDNRYPIETLLPIAPPLLPPENPMRASISPKLYLAIYDRTIIHSMTPSCPINLSDMLPACVAGWKRDGEWPPRSAAPEPSMAMRSTGRVSAVPSSKRRSLGFLNREDTQQRGFRRGIQKVFGLGGAEQ